MASRETELKALRMSQLDVYSGSVTSAACSVALRN